MTTTTALSPSPVSRPQVVVAIGLLLLGLALAVGALRIPGGAGYGGVGPNFLPWLVALALAACGAVLLRQALGGGFRDLAPAEGSGDWRAFAWVSAGLLANAALITTIGFIFSCALCYVLAVQGLRHAAGQTGSSPRTWLVDAMSGLGLSAPVFWLFTKLLAINLPGLTGTGWL